jgi:hypothetical protein
LKITGKAMKDGFGSETRKEMDGVVVSVPDVDGKREVETFGELNLSGEELLLEGNDRVFIRIGFDPVVVEATFTDCNNGVFLG